MPPRDDNNSTDLYIPSTLLALIFIIFINISYGFSFLYNIVGSFYGNEQRVNYNACVEIFILFRFHPEVLGITATSCVMALAIEVILIKLGCYLLGIGGEIHFLDFIAFSGYKFCILIVSLAATVFGRSIKYCAFGYCIIAYGFFLVS